MLTMLLEILEVLVDMFSLLVEMLEAFVSIPTTLLLNCVNEISFVPTMSSGLSVITTHPVSFNVSPSSTKVKSLLDFEPAGISSDLNQSPFFAIYIPFSTLFVCSFTKILSFSEIASLSILNNPFKVILLIVASFTDCFI